MLRRVFLLAVPALAMFLLWAGLFGASVLAQEEAPGTYTVVGGDTLGEIATRFGVSLDDLIAANNIVDPALIRVGQVLVIPGLAAGQAAAGEIGPVQTTPILAQPGDTLATLARRVGADPAYIAAINGMTVTTRLFPGQPVAVLPDQAPPEPLRFGSILDVEIPVELVQGRTGRVFVQSARPLSLTVTWNGLPLAPTPLDADPRIQVGLVPVPALLAPANYPLEIGYVAANGTVVTRTWEIAVLGGPYDSQIITLPEDRGALLAPEIMASELATVTQVWSQVTSPLAWPQAFLRPMTAEYPTTSPFGTRRSYNGGPYSSYHAGQDFGAPVGVPVLAPAAGTVALARGLDVRGNAVIIDHGRGIFSGYWHLSEMKVSEGQTINGGDVIGLVGNTGLSTGAHLHWELRIAGVAVDPMQFLDEPFVPPLGSGG